MRALLVATSVALLAVRTASAADCLTPLHETGGWACHADLSNGETADFCLEHTHTLGDDPATRFFKLNSTGLHVSTCTCAAKGKPPGVAFSTDKSMLCFDPKSDTLTSAKVSRRKITGQTFFGTSDVRSTFSCRPDPTCDVPPVIEPTVAGQVVYWFDHTTTTTNGADMIVITPSGAVHCNDGGVAVPLEAGPHDVWITSEVAGETVDAELVGVYDQD